jgi:uncharacterized OB-fold protein
MMTNKMIGVKCTNCASVYYPKRDCCPHCRSTKLEETKMGEFGTLVTYTKLWAVPKGISQMPLVLGIVQFDNGASVLGQLSAEEVTIGIRFKPVWAVVRKIQEKEVYGFKFEPV